MQKKSWWIVSIAALCAALGGFWLARELDSSGPDLASGTWLPQARLLADFHLIDETGKDFSLSRLRGHPTLIFFGFTHCPDVCPTTLVQLAQVKRTAAIAGLQVLLVSVDPERDTPPVLAQYVHAFDPQFTGLTGNPVAIRSLASEFAVAVARVELPGGDYTMDHSAIIFLLDDQAREVAIFTPPFDARRLAQDLRLTEPYLAPATRQPT